MSMSREILQPEGYNLAAIESQFKSSDPLTRLSMVGEIGAACRKITPQHEAAFDAFGRVTLVTTKPAIFRDLVTPVIGLLDDQEPLVQKEAIWTLGEMGGVEAREALRRMITNEDADIRAGAVSALGRIGDEESVVLIKNALSSDPDDSVRFAAVDALGNILARIAKPITDHSDEFGHVIHDRSNEEVEDATEILLDQTQSDVPADYRTIVYYGRGRPLQEQSKLLKTLLDVAETEEFGHVVRLEAAVKIAKSGNSAAIAQLRDLIKRHSLFAIVLEDGPLSGLCVHPEVDPEESRRLSKHLGGIISPEELQEMIDIGMIVKNGEGKLTKVHSVVEEIVRATNQRFFESINLPPTLKRTLCAFTSNIDKLCYLKNQLSAQQKINKAVIDAAAEAVAGKEEEIKKGEAEGKSRQQMIDEIGRQVIKEIREIIYEPDPKKLPPEVSTKAQIVGFVLRTFKHSGGKVAVAGTENVPCPGKLLADWIKNTFHPESEKVGGASAQMGDFLTGISEEKVVVYTTFHSPAQARAYRQRTNLLRVTAGSCEIHKVNDPKSIGAGDPTKLNYAVELSPGVVVQFDGEKFEAGKNPDRIIFTTEYYDKDDRRIDFVPLFEFTPEVLSKIGKDFEYFIINGPHYLQRYPKDKYNYVAPLMREQLAILKAAGMIIHYEFSGSTCRKVKEGRWAGIRYFVGVLRGNITSMGINHKELKEVVASLKTELGQKIEVAEGDDAYSNYRNAVTLANYLGLDRLYVHGHSTDVTIRRNSSPEELKIEVRADMHAKHRVVQWLKGEKSKFPTPEKRRPARNLKVEGYVELMDFAEKMAEDSGTTVIEKVRRMRDLAIKGYDQAKEEEGYSVVVVPVKGIYGDIEVTTSAGDITSSSAFIQSGLDSKPPVKRSSTLCQLM